MRFFAAAILNPKLFALKLDTPDVEVSRTLVLVSKILQRLANCVVSAHPLTNKEQWLTPILQRFSDGEHKIAMIRFLDKISEYCASQQDQAAIIGVNFVNNENISPPGSTFYEPTVLKSGYLIERRSGPVKKRSFKNFIHPKRRLVVLTNAVLNWQKCGSSKDVTSQTTIVPSSAMIAHSLISDCDGNAAENPKSQIALSDITSVGVISDAKYSFRVATVNTEVHFQANSEHEMNEWIILIQKQQRHHLMILNRTSTSHPEFAFPVATEIDLERELHIVHLHLADHLDTLCDWGWCCRFECAKCSGKRIEDGEEEEQQGKGEI